MGPVSFHVLDSDSALFDWPLLLALEACEHREIILGPERARRWAESVAPALRILANFSAPKWSVRSNAMALRRGMTIRGLTDATALCWGERTEAIVARSNIARPVPVPQGLWRVPKVQTETRTIAPDRRAFRQALGVNDDEKLVAGLGARGTVDAFRLVHIAGVLCYAGEHVTVVVPRDSPGLERACRMVRRHRRGWRIAVPESPGPAEWAGADAAICLPLQAVAAASASERAMVESKSDWMRASGIPVVDTPAEEGIDSDLAIARTLRAVLEADPVEPSSDAGGFAAWRDRIDELARPNRQSA